MSSVSMAPSLLGNSEASIIRALMSYQSYDIMVKGKGTSSPPEQAGLVPEPGVGKRGASGHIAYLLRQANAAVRLELEHVFSEFDVTLPQFSVLTMIAAYPPLSGADVARLTLLTPQTVNVITRNLIKRGLLTQRPDEVHGRILRLEMTKKGKEVLEACKVQADSVETRLLSNLTGDGEKAVRAWLVSIAKLSYHAERDDAAHAMKERA